MTVNLYYIGYSAFHMVYVPACELCAQACIYSTYWYIEVAMRNTCGPCVFCEKANRMAMHRPVAKQLQLRGLE